MAPKALAVAALQRLRRGPLATAPLATLARFLHSGLLGHPLHLEQHRGAYRAHADALRAGLCDACGANTTGHRRRPRGAGSGCRVLDDGDSSDRCAGCLSRHTAPYLLAATHAGCAWPVRSPFQSPRTCRMPVKRCVAASELALTQATRSAERAHHTLPVCAGFGKQLGLDPATLGVGQLTQAILSGAAPVAAAFSCQRRTRAHPRAPIAAQAYTRIRRRQKEIGRARVKRRS